MIENLFEKLFENVGSKIKTVAKVYFAIMLIAEVVVGISLPIIEDDFILFGLLMIVVGPFVAWLSSLYIYGFGELVENSTLIRQKMSANDVSTQSEELPTL